MWPWYRASESPTLFVHAHSCSRTHGRALTPRTAAPAGMGRCKRARAASCSRLRTWQCQCTRVVEGKRGASGLRGRGSRHLGGGGWLRVLLRVRSHRQEPECLAGRGNPQGRSAPDGGPQRSPRHGPAERMRERSAHLLLRILESALRWEICDRTVTTLRVCRARCPLAALLRPAGVWAKRRTGDGE